MIETQLNLNFIFFSIISLCYLTLVMLHNSTINPDLSAISFEIRRIKSYRFGFIDSEVAPMPGFYFDY